MCPFGHVGRSPVFDLRFVAINESKRLRHLTVEHEPVWGNDSNTI